MTGGQLTLFTEPAAGVDPILAAIGSARHRVDLVMYEDEDAQVDAALSAAERRDVSVRVLLNGGYYGAGSPDNRPAFDYLRSHGVAVRWTPSYFALTHQKTLVVDGRAFILTFNLTPQYYASSRDFGIVDGDPADVDAIVRTFDADYDHQRITAPSGRDLVWSPGSQSTIVSLIASATRWLDIENEEMDSSAIESALEAAARRGVDVRVTMTADSSWTSAFAQLAAAGVHIRLYAASAPLYIHAKLILTPARTFVGSENFSTGSMEDNRELGIITADGSIRLSLKRTFDGDYAGARPYAAATTRPSCTVSAAYSSEYDNYDVYVRSDSPDTPVYVSDSAGHSASWHTDSSGYADVYLKTGGIESGQTVTASVGGATCHTSL